MCMRSIVLGRFYAAYNGSLLSKFQDNLSVPSSRVKRSKQLKQHSINTTERVKIVEAYNMYRRNKKLVQN